MNLLKLTVAQSHHTYSWFLHCSLSLTSLHHLGWWPVAGWGSRCETPCCTHHITAACEHPASHHTRSKSRSDILHQGRPCSAYTLGHSFLQQRTFTYTCAYTVQTETWWFYGKILAKCTLTTVCVRVCASCCIRLNCPSAVESARAPGFSTW